MPRENSKRDKAEDAAKARKPGMTPDQLERSAADKRHDAPAKRVPQRDGLAKYAKSIKAI